MPPKALKSNERLVKLLYAKKIIAKPNITDARPAVSTVLRSANASQVKDVVTLATKTGELDSQSLLDTLRSFRKFKRYDKAERVLRACEAAEFPLKRTHYTTMMALATDAGRWVDSIGYFETMAEKKMAMSSPMFSALMTALNTGGKWGSALEAYQTMLRSRIQPDAYAVHGAMLTARRRGLWDTALSCFSSAVMLKPNPHVPNAEVYREVLRSLEQSAMKDNTTAWHIALGVLTGIQGVVQGVGAGHYNAAIRVLLATKPSSDKVVDDKARLKGAVKEMQMETFGRWEQALDVFTLMKENPTLEPNENTVTSLIESVPQPRGLLVDALRLGVPLTEAMHRRVLSSLVLAKDYAAATALVHRLVKQATDDPGNTAYRLQDLYKGLLDALLIGPHPELAQKTLDECYEEVASVVGLATGGPGSIGNFSQLWVVTGRVCVVDETALMAWSFWSLRERYDAVIVPFTVVRKLKRMQEEMPLQNKMQREQISKVLKMLVESESRFLNGIKDESGVTSGQVRVFPLVHQLEAHKLVRSGGDADTNVSNVEERRAHTERNAAGGADEEEDEGLIPIRSELDVAGPGAVLVPDEPTTVAEIDLDLDLRNTMASVIAVAAQLQRLNTDAELHLVTGTHPFHYIQLLRTSKKGRRAKVLPVVSLRQGGKLRRAAPSSAEVDTLAKRAGIDREAAAGGGEPKADKKKAAGKKRATGLDHRDLAFVEPA